MLMKDLKGKRCLMHIFCDHHFAAPMMKFSLVDFSNTFGFYLKSVCNLGERNRN